MGGWVGGDVPIGGVDGGDEALHFFLRAGVIVSSLIGRDAHLGWEGRWVGGWGEKVEENEGDLNETLDALGVGFGWVGGWMGDFTWKRTTLLRHSGYLTRKRSKARSLRGMPRMRSRLFIGEVGGWVEED